MKLCVMERVLPALRECARRTNRGCQDEARYDESEISCNTVSVSRKKGLTPSCAADSLTDKSCLDKHAAVCVQQATPSEVVRLTGSRAHSSPTGTCRYRSQAAKVLGALPKKACAVSSSTYVESNP